MPQRSKWEPLCIVANFHGACTKYFHTHFFNLEAKLRLSVINEVLFIAYGSVSLSLKLSLIYCFCQCNVFQYNTNAELS